MCGGGALPIALAAALFSSGCGPSVLVTAPVDRIAATQSTGLGELRYVCTVAPSRALPGETPIGGCMRTEVIELDGTRTTIAYGMRNELCIHELARCSARSATFHVREESGVVAAVVEASGGDELHAMYVAKGARALRWKSSPKASTSAEALLRSMPSRTEAIDARLRSTSTFDDSGVVEDHLWEHLATEEALRRHLDGVSERVKRCGAPDAVLPRYVAVRGAQAYDDVYTSIATRSCKAGASFLVARRPPELAERLQRDLQQVSPYAQPVAERIELAVAYGASMAPAIDAVLRRLSIDFEGRTPSDNNKLFFRATAQLATIDRDRAASLLLWVLRSIPSNVDTTESPWAAVPDGEPARASVYLGSMIARHDSPAVRAELAAIARDTRAAPAARKVALGVLGGLGDSVYGEITDVALNPSQRSAIDYQRTRPRP